MVPAFRTSSATILLAQGGKTRLLKLEAFAVMNSPHVLIILRQLYLYVCLHESFQPLDLPWFIHEYVFQGLTSQTLVVGSELNARFTFLRVAAFLSVIARVGLHRVCLVGLTPLSSPLPRLSHTPLY